MRAPEFAEFDRASSMTDVFDKAKRSLVMAAIRSVGNRTTELALVSAFRRLGIKGWRRHTNLPGKPDFVFREARLAVFVDGCFWHGCPEHGHRPRSNRAYWVRKLGKNEKRDQKIKQELRKRSWKVLRFWEHQVKASPTNCARKVRRLLLRCYCTKSGASRSANPS